MASKIRRKSSFSESLFLPTLHVENFAMKGIWKSFACLKIRWRKNRQTKNSLVGKSERAGFKMPDEA